MDEVVSRVAEPLDGRRSTWFALEAVRTSLRTSMRTPYALENVTRADELSDDRKEGRTSEPGACHGRTQHAYICFYQPRINLPMHAGVKKDKLSVFGIV